MSIEKDVRNFLEGISENCKKYFICSTDKNPLTYKSGEEMIFTLKVKTDTCDIPVPHIKVSCSADDGISEEKIISAGDDGTFTLKTKCNRDGFVRVIATALDENFKEIEGVDKFEGGAGADIEKIKLCTTTPEDYFEFWDKLKKGAFEFPVKILYKNDISNDNGYVITDYRFETKAGKFLSLVTTYPKEAKPQSLKFKMVFMGYGMNNAPITCSPGYFSVCMNSHDVENGLTVEEYSRIKTTYYQNYGFSKEENQLPETSYWYKMYFRNLQAFNIFKDNELLNKKDYIFIGGSQGAMQACHMALHSGYATECFLNVAWCCDLWAIEKEKRMKGWRPDISNAMNYFDTALAASYLKCPVYIEAGLGDYVCPPSGQMAMYNVITAPKMLRFIQNQTHPYRPPVRETFELIDGYNNINFHF